MNLVDDLKYIKFKKIALTSGQISISEKERMKLVSVDSIDLKVHLRELSSVRALKTAPMTTRNGNVDHSCLLR